MLKFSSEKILESFVKENYFPAYLYGSGMKFLPPPRKKDSESFSKAKQNNSRLKSTAVNTHKKMNTLLETPEIHPILAAKYAELDEHFAAWEAKRELWADQQEALEAQFAENFGGFIRENFEIVQVEEIVCNTVEVPEVVGEVVEIPAPAPKAKAKKKSSPKKKKD